MSELKYGSKAYCAHPVEKTVDDGSGPRTVLAKCGLPMDKTTKIVRDIVPGGNGQFLESIEHGMFCERGHRAGRR